MDAGNAKDIVFRGEENKYKNNCGDLPAKHLSQNDAKRHLDYMSMEVTAGRSATAPVFTVIVNSVGAKMQRRLRYEKGPGEAR